MTELKALEDGLFTWDGWYKQNIMCFEYHGVELVTQIGEFPVGTVF